MDEGIAKRLWARRPGIRVPVGGSNCSLLQNAHTAICQEYRGSFQGVKGTRREADHSPPSSAEVKNEWNYISLPPTHFYTVDTENCTVLCTVKARYFLETFAIFLP